MNARRPLRCLPVLAVVAAVVAAVPAHAAARNVIVLLADGVGSSHLTAARWVAGGPLAVDGMAAGVVRTYASDSIITDSAPGATAYACGVKTSNGQLGVLPSSVTIPGVPEVGPIDRTRPVASLLDAARLAGRATGIVATSNVQHASPAAFSSHWPDRGDTGEIALQQTYTDLDVVLGGGWLWMLPPAAGGRRGDGADLLAVLKERGAAVVRTRAELAEVTAGPVWGLFAPSALANDLDRAALAPSEPTLAEMTAKAIEVLAADPQGFALFVEGSKIDWAAHANDPVGVVTELLAFDRAVGVALDYARGHGDTVVAVVADHATGGMSIGNRATESSYAHLPVTALTAPLRAARATAEGVARALGEQRDAAGIRAVMADLYAVDDLSDAEIAAIADSRPRDLPDVIGPMKSARSAVGWTTSGHTGEDVLLFSYGIDRPLPVLENAAVGRLLAATAGLDLDAATAALFADAEAACALQGCAVAIDRADPSRPVFTLRQGEASATVAASTDEAVLQLGGGAPTEVRLDGIAVYAPRTGRAYVPRELLQHLAAAR